MSDAVPPRLLVLTGPTASGKTELAIALADSLPVSLISVDSALVYRGMNIGTAKPDADVLKRYPHALVDVRDPAEPFSAAEFVELADAAVRSALAAGRLPVLVGGTMLYLKAFRDGIAPLPPADVAVRAEIVRDAERLGADALHRRLAAVDPVAAERIHPHNLVRLQRALEVHALTGEPISSFWSRSVGASRRLGVRLDEYALVPGDRAALHARIEARLRAMLDAGFVDEVRALRARGDLHPGLPSMRAVGYRQIWEHLDGIYDEEGLFERALFASRQLAKRQLTWLRRWDWVTSLAADGSGDHPGSVEALALKLARSPTADTAR